LVARYASPLRRSMNIEVRAYISQGLDICGESRYYLPALDKAFTRPSLTKLEMHGRPRPTPRCDRMAWRGLWPPLRLALSRSLALLATLVGERFFSASDGSSRADLAEAFFSRVRWYLLLGLQVKCEYFDENAPTSAVFCTRRRL
jgi:hypothetical protein